MHEIHATGFYQLRRGVYVNVYGDTACFLDEGSFFTVYYRGEYFVYAIKCNPAVKLGVLNENKLRLTVDPVIRNYCDGSGNKIELSRKMASFSLVIIVNEADGLSEIQRLSDPYVAVISNSFLPAEYTDIVNALAEKPIDIEITSEPADNVTLNISNCSIGNNNEHLLISKLLSLRSVRFVYPADDEEIEAFLRRHNVPKKLRWPITAE